MKLLTNVDKNNNFVNSVQGMLAHSLKPLMHYPTSWSGEMHLMSQFEFLHVSQYITHTINQQSTVLYDIVVGEYLPSFADNT